MKKIILVLFILCNVFSSVWAFDIKTLWTINSYVIDKVWVLNSEEKNEIEQKIEALRTKYSTEILTIIINTTDWEDISSVWTQIWHELWVWKADKDNWVVILIAIDDRAWNISTGYWVEWVLPDILTNRIWENNFVLFRDEKYKDWIMWALNDFDKAFSWDTSIISTQKYEIVYDNYLIILIFIALVFSMIFLNPVYKEKQYTKLFLYLFIWYIITLPLAYFLIKTTELLFSINAIAWLIWVFFWISWKKWPRWLWWSWGGSRWWFGWFWWWGFGWGWSSWRW